MERIAIVTDNACDASDAELAEMGVECVHLSVTRSDGTQFPSDNTPENIEAYYAYIPDCEVLPTTASPSPLAFAELYNRLVDEGYTHIISLHISSAMSGTVDVARIAAKDLPIQIEAIDTKCNTVGQYMYVRRIAQLRNAGASFDELVAECEFITGKTSIVFMLDTLRNLVKGGRTGKAVGLAASLLNIKPLLTVDPSGEVDMFGKAKSIKRAVDKLTEYYVQLQDKFGPLECCFVHTRNMTGVNALRESFIERGIPFDEVDVRQVGPVITTHVSVGCFGFAYIPKAHA